MRDKEAVCEGANFGRDIFGVPDSAIPDVVKADAGLATAEQFAEEFDEEPHELDDAHRALHSCMGKLRDQDRVLLRKRYAENVTLETYASEINRSAGTLKARLFKIRSALRQCIQREIAREGGLA